MFLKEGKNRAVKLRNIYDKISMAPSSTSQATATQLIEATAFITLGACTCYLDNMAGKVQVNGTCLNILKRTEVAASTNSNLAITIRNLSR